MKTADFHAGRLWLTSRLVGIILNPRRTLKEASIESKAWVPILVVVLTLIGLRLVDMPADMLRFSDPVYISSYIDERGIDSTSAMMEISAYKSSYPALMLFTAPLLVIGNVVIISLIIYLIGKHAFKSDYQYSIVMNMVAWATVISAFQFILNAITRLIKPGATFPTNLSVFFSPETTDTFLYNLLQLLDVFLFWEAYLLGVGLTVLYKISNQRAFNTIGTLFIVIIALNAMLASFSL